jgi:hypothetical protein
MPAAATAPPPAAASPPPAAPAAPPSPPASAPAAPQTKAEYSAEIDADLDALDTDRKPVAEPKAKAAPSKPAAAAATAPKAEGDDLPPGEDEEPETPSATAPVLPEDQPSPTRVPELRKAYDSLKPVIKELRGKITAAENKVKELESRKPEDNAPVLKELETTKKRNDQLESVIRFKDYESSKEFETQYKQPYLEAWNAAVGDFEQLTVRVPDGVEETTGEAKFKTRPATANDLLQLANLPLNEMDDKAAEMFGRSSARVIRHVEEVRKLAVAQQKALNKAREESAEHGKVVQAQTKAQQDARIKLWNDKNVALAAKYPKWFAPVEGETEENALLQKGFALADRMFSPTPETAPKTPEEALNVHLKIRNKAANHDRLALRLNKANARITELETALKEYEKSEPPGGAPRSTGPAGVAKTFTQEVEDELDAIDRKHQ